MGWCRQSRGLRSRGRGSKEVNELKERPNFGEMAGSDEHKHNVVDEARYRVLSFRRSDYKKGRMGRKVALRKLNVQNLLRIVRLE